MSQGVRGVAYKGDENFRFKIFRHTWGVTDDLTVFLNNLATEKPVYNGIEAGLIWLNDEQKVQLREGLAKHNLEYIAMLFTDLPFRPLFSVDEHVQQFETQLQEALTFNPVLVNVHGGRDSWNREQAEEYFTRVLDISRRCPVPIVHETHRARILYNPWATRDWVRRFDDLLLCADLSHWVNVAERLNWDDDGQNILQLIAPRVKHIHARVGYEEGPQVSDPRAPEWETHVTTFRAWWTTICEAQKAAGAAVISLTPEYGPPTYLHTLPYTQAPVANLVDIVDWAARDLAQTFSA
eukprot:TRINITY_DN17326_c0_g2_i1.p1 TRINITY_DN17326_c0_g2~~TRINITY_DN17326_c0_g2_i1.p1  ORF type:complete len:295 (+),score=73.75 TRINITY_DN17326_c0_g2_i1:57-941(+)